MKYNGDVTSYRGYFFGFCTEVSGSASSANAGESSDPTTNRVAGVANALFQVDDSRLSKTQSSPLLELKFGPWKFTVSENLSVSFLVRQDPVSKVLKGTNFSTCRYE